MFKSKKSILLSVLAVVLVAALAVGAYFLYDSLKPETEYGSKTVTVIVTKDGEVLQNASHKTDAEYLEGVLRENNIAEFSSGQYGVYIESACGIKADSSSEFWAIYLNGEMTQYGASEQPVKDGETYELRLEKFW